MTKCKISPRFMEYGVMTSIKNGWKVIKLFVSLKPTPSVGETQMALLTQLVIEWGTFLTNFASPLKLKIL